MSLNGLDDAKVTEAYQGALAEAGGWFLLKYASRDAVDVLTRGTGGAAEARGAVAQYEEKSPLYGFLLYRRRKVIIKYLPEGTSRLLQARVAVHFTAVTDKFTPHDTTISITSADELSDAALISACSLHTAAPSSCSSSGSSRRQKLDEITEDAEEGQSTADDTVSVARPATAASSIPTIVEPPPAEIETVATAPEPLVTSQHPKRSSSLVPAKTTEDLQSALEQPKVEAPIEEAQKPGFNAQEYRESLKNYDALFEHGPDPRASSQTVRPALSDLYAEIYAQYNKPKVKLGPRPSQRPSMDSKRPSTSGAGAGAQSASRPVSSLPAGMRVANRKTMEPKRPKSRDTSVVPSIAFPPPPPVPNVPEVLYTPQYNPPKSPASVKSMPYTLSHRTPAVTPEKQRLMKALELRKKQMKARKEKEAKSADQAPEESKVGAEENAKDGEEPVVGAVLGDIVQTEGSTAANPEDASATTPHDDELSSKNDNSTLDALKPAVTPADSAIEMMGHQPENDDQQSAASACSPTSAQTQGSSCAPSTRPSSISEDEAVAAFIKEDAENTTEGSQEILPNEDEQDSVESTPTVVPDNASPEPSSDTTEAPVSPDAIPRVSLLEAAPVKRNNRESMVFLKTPSENDSESQRRSKRESAIFLPAGESSQLVSALSSREKRKSALFSAPKWQNQFEEKEKRRPNVDPIQIHLSAENSEAEYLSDDSFMEELQSAKFEQAQPIQVSKSPITPVFPRKSSVSSAMTVPERATSQQYLPGRFSPEQSKGRKSSGPWMPHANTDTVVVAKKINVSSGISQRIKALAEKSNRDSTASVSPLATPDANTSTVAQRKSSFFSTPPSGNSPNGQSIKRLTRASFASLTNPLTPNAKIASQPPPSSPALAVYNVQQSPKKPESVQVTARIVRDGRTQQPTLTMPTEITPLELHQSQIIIDHQRSTRPPSRSKTNPPKSEPVSPRPPSSSHSRDQSSSALPRSSSESSWRSFGRRLSESRPPPRSQSIYSLESADEKREEKKDKKDSRTSKLLKRMSGFTSASRKNSNARESLEDDHQTTYLPSLREPPPAVQVGDLNVQFPDTLLWKRRWVEIDGTGNLVLSLSRSNDQSKGITKRFHLTEFRMPYVPDQDRQELPNSVILDFVDGRTLQCACETYVAQVQVLQILREAHDAWLAYGQFS